MTHDELKADLEGLEGLTVEEIRPWHTEGVSVKLRAAGSEVHLYHEPDKPWRAVWGLLDRTGLSPRGALIELGWAIQSRHQDLVRVLMGSLWRKY